MVPSAAELGNRWRSKIVVPALSEFSDKRL